MSIDQLSPKWLLAAKFMLYVAHFVQYCGKQCDKNTIVHIFGRLSCNLNLFKFYSWVIPVCRYPGPPYETLPLISGICFDNFTVKVNYNTLHAIDDGMSYRLDMTNWATIHYPRAISPTLNIARVLQINGGWVYKQDFDKYSIADLFHPDHPDIVGNKQRRWTVMMLRKKAGTLLHRNNVPPKYGKTAFKFQTPVFGRLQSSNEDVEQEMDVFRSDVYHKETLVMFAGGDGLSTMRLEHAVARERFKYLFTFPIVIPVRGDHPHGSCHIAHGGWRLWWKLIEVFCKCADYEFVEKDWDVKMYKHYDFACVFMMDAISEFLLEIADGCANIMQVNAFYAACEQNIDLCYLAHFLDDFSFMYWQFRQAVRDCNYEEIDLVWREDLGTMLTQEGHKTQYAPMTVAHIYRSQALIPELQHVFNEYRCLAMSKNPSSQVGFDMPIENENGWIRSDVIPPNEDRIQKYVKRLAFLAPTSQGLKDVMHHNRQHLRPGKLKSIDGIKRRIKNHLYMKLVHYDEFIGPLELGEHWQKACSPRTNSRLMSGVTSSNVPPWRKIREGLLPTQHTHNKERYDSFVKRMLDIRVTWH